MKRTTLMKFTIYALVMAMLMVFLFGWPWWFPRGGGKKSPGTTHGWVMPVEKAVRV